MNGRVNDPTLMRDREGEDESRREGLRQVAITAVMLAVLAGVVFALLWIDSWWPAQLLPWPDVERL